jgi:predicted nucleotidyltransferase
VQKAAANVSDAWLDQPELRLGSLLRRLTEAGVDFVVVGGVAVVLQAAPRFTKDLDICYATAPNNLERLGEVLIEIEAMLRGVEEDLPFVPDGRTLRKTQMLKLSTREGNLDLLVCPEGSPDYAQLRSRADRMELDGLTVAVASVEDLIAMKRAAGRPQDLLDLESLEIARRRRG